VIRKVVEDRLGKSAGNDYPETFPGKFDLLKSIALADLPYDTFHFLTLPTGAPVGDQKSGLRPLVEVLLVLPKIIIANTVNH